MTTTTDTKITTITTTTTSTTSTTNITQHTSISSVDFFDNAFTFSNESVTVHCCHPNNTIELSTCGLGTSCLGSCSLLGAQLCPSGDCSGDCQLPVDQGMDQNGTQTRSSLASNYNCVYTKRCDVCKHRVCCANPVCKARRPRQCRWMDYRLSSCPFIPASWASWGPWASCSRTCGGGVRVFHIQSFAFFFMKPSDTEQI